MLLKKNVKDLKARAKHIRYEGECMDREVIGDLKFEWSNVH